MSVLLDTHAWIWWVDQDRRLGTAAIAALDGLPRTERPCLCDISLWEVGMLVAAGRLGLDVPLADWLAAAAHPRSVRLMPITPAIAAGVAALPAPFQRDPADRLIVATARAHALPVLTHDRRILASRLVKRWRPARSRR
ncbi:MAG: type II toxin-antitoxin system VapC family toxin [Acidobacteria bacterium]|nr:type II toxin-antitoxin system VapC family toxin [Acidobacteriota bacterium]